MTKELIEKWRQVDEGLAAWALRNETIYALEQMQADSHVCPSCGNRKQVPEVGGITESIETETMQVAGLHKDLTPVEVEVRVLGCPECGMQWTGSDAEDERNEAVNREAFRRIEELEGMRDSLYETCESLREERMEIKADNERLRQAADHHREIAEEYGRENGRLRGKHREIVEFGSDVVAVTIAEEALAAVQEVSTDETGTPTEFVDTGWESDDD